MRMVFTRLPVCKLLTPGGGSSAISGPESQSKDGTGLKKHRTTWFRFGHVTVGMAELGRHDLEYFFIFEKTVIQILSTQKADRDPDSGKAEVPDFLLLGFSRAAA